MVMFSDIAAFAEAALEADVYHTGSDFEIVGVATASSLSEGCLAFSKVVDETLVSHAKDTKQAVLILPKGSRALDCACILTENPRYTYAAIVTEFFATRPEPGIDRTALIDSTAQVDETATIGPFCVIGPNVVIGARTVLHTHITLARNVVIGADCVILSHSVIGEDGFGADKDTLGNLLRIPHLGGVRIGGRVHVGSLNSIASGTIEPTVINDGAHLDNLVHVGHNVSIGMNCQIAACAEISGSVKIGRNVWISPNASIIQKVEIGENSIIGIGAAVTKSIPADVVVAGVPAKVLRHLEPSEIET